MNQNDSRCQIYLEIPPDIPVEAFERLAEAEALGAAASVLLRGGEGRIDLGIARALLGLAHRVDIPLVIENDAALAKDMGADGVHVSDGEDAYGRARELLGEDRIVGADCGLSRHAAMTLAERGADYVAFAGEQEPLEEIIAWWSEVTVVPCVARGAADLTAALTFARAGADFVGVCDAVWQHPAGPEEAMMELAARLAKAREAA